jgi:hypothetical protein
MSRAISRARDSGPRTAAYVASLANSRPSSVPNDPDPQTTEFSFACLRIEPMAT